MGKDWSRGLTKETDTRVARAAAAHVGRTYVRRLSAAVMAARGMRREPLVWTPDTAYAVGLAATDGNLGRDGRAVSMGSMDREQIETFLRCVGRIGAHISEEDGPYYRTQLSDRSLHVFLTEAGLTPNKSLTLGALIVPDMFFWDLTRGLVDGDGSIKTYVHNPIKKTYPEYRYERLEVMFHTASRAHAEWVQAQLRRRGLASALLPTVRTKPLKYAGHLMFKVKMGKHASIEALANMYRDPNAPRLTRKWEKWDAFCARNSKEATNADPGSTLARRRSYAAITKALSSGRYLN